MKHPCPNCAKQFDDAEWLKLHVSAQHGRERETKQRGKGGGRKSSHAVHNNTNWTKTAPSSVSLMDHFRPAEKPKFESEPVNMKPSLRDDGVRFNFDFGSTPKDIVDDYRYSQLKEAPSERKKELARQSYRRIKNGGSGRRPRAR